MKDTKVTVACAPQSALLVPPPPPLNPQIDPCPLRPLLLLLLRRRALRSVLRDPAINLALVRSAAERAQADGARMLFAPELMLTGHGAHPSMADNAEPVPEGPLAQAVLGMSAELGIAICVGIAELDPSDLQIYNSQFVVCDAAPITPTTPITPPPALVWLTAARPRWCAGTAASTWACSGRSTPAAMSTSTLAAATTCLSSTSATCASGSRSATIPPSRSWGVSGNPFPT